MGLKGVVINQVTAWFATLDEEKKGSLWGRLILDAILAIYLYVFMEWLFFVTKPSFMDVMGGREKIEVLLITGLGVFLLVLPFLLIALVLSYIPGISKIWKLTWLGGVIVPAIFLAFTSLLLIDNFTYTVFKWGIVSTNGAWRGLYAVLVLFLGAVWYRWFFYRLTTGSGSGLSNRPLRIATSLCAGLLVVSISLAIPKLNLGAGLGGGQQTGGIANPPNILLLGSDGVNAGHMSVYGYERDSTPNIRQLAETSLVADNAFTNSANSSGSIISMLTSKLPTQTRVIYPPDILRGPDAYQHLPGILHSKGYRTIEISVPHYIDAYTLNLQNGFDQVNQKSIDMEGIAYFSQKLPALQNVAYFSSVLVERLADRLRHIFYLRRMTNPYQEVTGEETSISDRERIDLVLRYFKESDQPLFIHVHLMGTHGGKFYPRQQVFSAGQEQDDPWMDDFYDDAILDYDAYAGEVIERLTEWGLLDHTIVVIDSDHGQQYVTDGRIPLIFHFPYGEYARRIHANVQMIDVAPTLLDYLGVSVPDWMDGQSLLTGEPDPTRPVFSTAISYAIRGEEGTFVLDSRNIKPPFYQFGYLRAIVCQKWYLLNLMNLEWESGEVQGHTAPCREDLMPEPEAIQAQMLDRLERDGFDVTSIPSSIKSSSNMVEP
jgi:arylsulfatase A-like enzyme